MDSKISFVVSDLHLGSPYFLCENFLAWLDNLPDQAQLILNGDVIDDPKVPLSPEHRAVLERLVAESHQRPMVWVYGNHDAQYVAEEAGKIHFVRHWEIGRRLLVVHGDGFDEIMPKHKIFKTFFRLMHKIFVKLGLPDVHVAQYAKQWKLFYRVLNTHVARKALLMAKQRGFEAVTCGHTHSPMDIERDGVRYLNTGAWTEKPPHYLAIDEEQIDLRKFENGLSRR